MTQWRTATLLIVTLTTLISCQKSEQPTAEIPSPQPTVKSTPKPTQTPKKPEPIKTQITLHQTPLPQTTQIKVAFNQDQSSIYTDPYRNITRHGTNLETLIVQEIQSAQTSIDIAIQALSLPTIAHALAQRQKAGIKVRVMLENNYAKPWIQITPQQAEKLTPEQQSILAEFFTVVDVNKDNILSHSEINNQDVLTIFRNNRIVWKDDTSDRSKGSGLMHHKFIVIDKRKVVTGSPNFTLSSLHGDKGYPDGRGNAEHLIVIKSESLAKLYTEEFNLMWSGKFGVKKPKRPVKSIKISDIEVRVNFSPDSQSDPYNNTSNGIISQTISTAKQSVDFALFVFSDQGIANQLNLQQKKKVKIRGIVDPNFAYVNYSKTLDMWGIATADKNCKSEQIPWQRVLTTVGVPQITKSDKMHHKFAVIDNNTVITGSHNWTEAGNYRNDENLLVIKSPIVAAHFEREMERLLKGARFNPNKVLLIRAKQSIERCGTLTAQKAKNDELINLNIASIDELDKLPSIGKSLAIRIVDARPIKSWEDLGRIKGMTEKKMEKIKDKVTF